MTVAAIERPNGFTGNAEDRALAEALFDALKQANVDVREFKMGELVVRVTRKDDQREGTTYYVTHLSSGSGLRRRLIVEEKEQ